MIQPCLALGMAIAIPVFTCAQPYWRPLGRGIVGATEVQTLFGDSASNRLLAGGTFQRIMNESDTVLGAGQAAWDGIRWDSIANRIQPITSNVSCDQTFWFLRFQGDLYSCGTYTFWSSGGQPNTSFARLNESTETWDALECPNPALSLLNQLVPKEPQGNSIYATGFANDLCGYPQACVYRYDGSAFYEWEPWALIPFDSDNYVGYVFEFQGMTYMTGGFDNPNQPGIAYFMRYNGSNWEDVPGWNNAPAIKDILIRDDVLYVAGAFKESMGAPGNRIASFDGTSWNNMLGGLTLSFAPNNGSAMTLWWHHSKLYVGGFFDEAGGGQLGGGLAVWDGYQWFSVPGEFSSSPPSDTDRIILDITTWRDSLYICGMFNFIDGDSIKDVAQFIGSDSDLIPVSVQEAYTHAQLAVAPNPVSEYLAVRNAPLGLHSFEIVDELGRSVLTGSYSSSTIDVTTLRAGPYALVARDRSGAITSRARFIKY